MQKVLDFLEKHVQWLALGLGVVWLLLMTWSYVLNPPAQVTIGSETLTAGEVDQYTVANAVRPLEEDMKPKDPPPMAVDNFAQRWLARMDWESAEPIVTAGLVHSRPPIPEVVLVKNMQPQTPVPNPNAPQQPGVQVTQAAGVPSPAPTPTVSDWRFGRSTIIKPPPVQVPGQPAVAAPPVPEEIDKDWITQSFKVSLPAIADLFKKHQVPAAPIGVTAFLKVEMVRQELAPNGQWGNETTVKPLEIGMLRQPFPAPKAGIHQENAYLNWAVQNTGDIVQPAFYVTVQNKGDMWQRPGEPAVPLQGGAFNVQQFLTGPIPPEVTPEQRALIMEARREAAKLRKQQQQQQRTPRTPRGGRGTDIEDPAMMEGNFAPLDPDRPKFLQVRQAYPRGAYAPEMDPAMMEDPAMMGLEGEFMEPMQPQILGVGQPDVDYPAGQFDPATWWVAPPAPPGAPAPVNPRPQEISIWAHDDTVQPGKTYRYKARYYIKNPLYQQPAAVKNPAAAREFAIPSDFSPWGPAIEVPALTNFFIANANLHQGKIRFDVYHWEKGLQHHTTVNVGPGDVITAQQNGVNFTTGYTVVDLRSDLRNREPVVFLADANGQPQVRTQKGDQNHPVNKKLKEVVEAAKALQQAALPPR